MNDDLLLDILMITYNRPEYTRRSLTALFDTIDSRVRVWIWHNGDDRETLEVVDSFRNQPCFHHLEVSKENLRLREPTNWFWQRSEAPFLSKLDDDCILSPGWFELLLDAHRKNPKLGIIGCWRFYDEDFLPEVAGKKIRDLNGGMQLLANPWIEGTGYLMKREVMMELGSLGPRQSFPNYCIQSALRGWQVGWHYPFIHQEHMDDPRSPYFGIKCEEDFERQKPLSAINNGVETLAQWRARVRYMAHVVQAASPNPWLYSGWRMRARNGFKRAKRMLGIREPWQKAQESSQGPGVGFRH